MVETFPGWRGKPLDDVFSLCREALEDPDCPTVARWREAGGKVLGHFQVYFPEEIAHAAGMLPMKVCGSPVEPKQADSYFGSYLCSILKTSLEQVLSKSVELDMFVTHPICDAARNLGAIWGRNYDYPCQILYLPQNPNSSYSIQYLRDEYDRLRRVVEEVVDRKISDEDLRNSLHIFNESRRLIRLLYSIKKERPWCISADEAYLLTALAGKMPREEHNELLRGVMPLLETRNNRKQDRIRVVFEGGFCEQPPLDLLRTIGQTCYVVDDDLLIGLRYLLEEVEEEGDPLMNLAQAYIEDSSYSPVQHDLKKPKEKMLLDRIRRSGAEAAIVAAAKMCEPGLEEQVTYIHALEEEELPYFVTEFEENMTSFDQLEIQLETFVENIIFD